MGITTAERLDVPVAFCRLFLLRLDLRLEEAEGLLSEGFAGPGAALFAVSQPSFQSQITSEVSRREKRGQNLLWT